MENKPYRFISADDHIDLRWLPKDLWRERLPARLRGRGPRVIENEQGSFWTWEDQLFRPFGGSDEFRKVKFSVWIGYNF